MTDTELPPLLADIEAFRAALEAEPTPAGAWEFGSYGAGQIRIGAAGDSKHGAFATMAGQWAVPWNSTDESRDAFNLAAYIAACHPERIARLLAALESARLEVAAWRERHPAHIYRPQDDCISLKWTPNE